MKLDQLATLVEKLRKEAVGEPLWVAKREVFEYPEQSAKVTALLKLVRAAHGVGAIDLLCRAGFFIDFGALIRCINDSVNEIYFLLEEFPDLRESSISSLRNSSRARLTGIYRAIFLKSTQKKSEVPVFEF